LWLGLAAGIILVEIYKAVKNKIATRKHG
jgi:hypothetical protein